MKGILIFILSFLVIRESSGQTLHLVMEDYFEKIGGKEKVAKIISSKEISYNWFNTASIKGGSNFKSLPIKAQTLLKTPCYRRFTSYDFSGDVVNEFFYNGKELIDVSRHGIRKEKISISSISVSVASDLYRWYIEGGLEYAGETYIENHTGGQNYYVITTVNQKNKLSFLFNSQTKLMEAKLEKDWPMRVHYFKDYRATNLILHPFLQESYENNVHYYKQETESFEYNPEIDNKDFYFDEVGFKRGIEHIEEFEPEVLDAGDYDFKTFINSKFGGKRILIDIWATWCNPCKTEFQSYDQIYYALLDSMGITPLYLSIDKDGANKSWKKDVKSLGLKGYHVRANDKIVNDIMRIIFQDKTIAIPRYVLINEIGQIISNDFIRPSDPNFKKCLIQGITNP